MQIVRVYDKLSYLNPSSGHGPALNIRQLLNPLFFSVAKRHPDSKRQRCARLRARALKQARELKTMHVPRNLVAPMDPPDGADYFPLGARLHHVTLSKMYNR